MGNDARMREKRDFFESRSASVYFSASAAEAQKTSVYSHINSHFTHGLAFHHIDIFHRDRPTVTEIDNQNSKADGCFSRSDGEDKHGKNLAGHVAEHYRKSNKIYIH